MFFEKTRVASRSHPVHLAEAQTKPSNTVEDKWNCVSVCRMIYVPVITGPVYV